MHEKSVQAKIGGREYSLLLNLAAYKDFTERYGSIFDVVGRLVPPDIEEGDTKKEITQKMEAKKTAEMYGLTEIPHLIDILTRYSGGEHITADQIGEIVMPYEFPELINAALHAVAVGMGTEHHKGASDVVDVTLEEIESKNVLGAAG